MSAGKLIVWSWIVILLTALFIWAMSQDWNVIRHVTAGERVSAGLFILMLLIWTAIEFGWLGGDRNRR